MEKESNSERHAQPSGWPYRQRLRRRIAALRCVLSPHGRSQGPGRVVVWTWDLLGHCRSYIHGSLYHSSKWAVEGLSEALHFEARLFGGRVKIVEPGGVNTDFGGRSFVFTNDEELGAYQPLVKAFMEAMGNMDTSGNQEPDEVAEVIWTAATDNSDQLRYISGAGARATLSSCYAIDQDEAFVAHMRKTYGL